MTTSGRSILFNAALALVLPFAAVGHAQDVRREPVHFAAGKSGASIKGKVQGDQSVEYVLGATAGQRMIVKLGSSNPSANFNILPPGSRTAIFMGSVQGPEFSANLTETGDYIVQVFLMRNAARRGEKASYKLDVKISGSPERAAVPAVEAEPAFYEVTGVTNDDPLNLRAGPSTQADRLATFGPGVVVQDVSCKTVEGVRWCQVALSRDPSVTGWVSGKFLTPTDRSERPETKPNAAVETTVGPASAEPGKVSCSADNDSFDAQCTAGAVPDPDGAVISVLRPDTGARRVLIFAAKDQSFTTADGADLAWLRKGDAWWVSANGAEFYLIPDALMAPK